MVQAYDTNPATRLHSDVIYAKIKEGTAKPGFSEEYFAADLDPKYHDKLDEVPALQGKERNYITALLKQVKDKPDQPFLGTRVKNEDGSLGGYYTWQTYKEVWNKVQNLAKGILELNLMPVQESINEDGRTWRFGGIWSKNRWEWTATFFASMLIKGTVIGFYDSMGN